ncbi:MAG TPA: hypothetical protein VM427_01655 [Patescibacteria group bacterium]|nr:hypothetical protein [Patescibacteria group bacterium]
MATPKIGDPAMLEQVGCRQLIQRFLDLGFGQSLGREGLPTLAAGR